MPQQSTAKLWLTIILPFGLGYFIATAFRNVNAILAHPIKHEMGLDAHEFGFVTSMFVLTFALVQLPLGILLDRWGARLTQVVFFSIAVTGAIVFGIAPNLWVLALGRALLGIGMAGGLMAAFKAVSDGLPKDKIPLYNGIILAAGGLGALFATTPSKLIETHFGWRDLCYLFGILTLGVTLLIALLGPKRQKTSGAPAASGLWQQVRTLGTIYKSGYFWRITPIFVTTLGGFIAMQGLWLDAWLRHVNQLTTLQSANYLLVIALAMTLGMVSGGLYPFVAKRLKASLAAVTVAGVIIHLITQVVIIIDVIPNNYVTWFVYGYFAQATLVFYAVIVQHFDIKLSGRVITAANIFVFLFAFLVQYLFGLIISVWPDGAAGIPVITYQAAFAGLVGIEILSLIWYFTFRKS